MEIDINRTIFELEKLVKESPLSEQERIKQIRNIQALRKLVLEWEQLKQNSHGNNDK